MLWGSESFAPVVSAHAELRRMTVAGREHAVAPGNRHLTPARACRLVSGRRGETTTHAQIRMCSHLYNRVHCRTRSIQCPGSYMR